MAAGRLPGTATPARVARAVWLGLVAASVLYLVVLGAAVPAGAGGVDGATLALVRTVLLGVAAAETVAVWAVWHRFVAPASERGPGTPPSGDPFVPLVVCWALGESIALYGLVLGLLGRQVGPVLMFFVWGLGVLAATRPREPFVR